MNGIDTRVVLCGLWITTLFVFAYVDIFGFYRADVINGVLAGEVPGTGFTIDQTFLLLTTLYIVVAALMVAVSLLARARINRIANIVVSLFYVVTAGATLIGELGLLHRRDPDRDSDSAGHRPGRLGVAEEHIGESLPPAKGPSAATMITIMAGALIVRVLLNRRGDE
ncbi:hypothetical protein GCM10010112_65320 [Actinoplanes lobatus]|uniref:Uncharacterized protein n=1 Tax=Actinoplanes lobatus TaxID=113568 RepID=A0A7W7HK42_9ACTN|nr:DUF6326 family protein [Actinoplanes lobatus]MBB4751991.1 hypothetical protein [Actinoplanes lobatus]GGN85174.1 hypothetical protein GCM10010112_65320 [Actinoplanes lobatus]GIE45321.1 hypothetical protein Alo02nite_82190 [Actinoplanes lobatus]